MIQQSNCRFICSPALLNISETVLGPFSCPIYAYFTSIMRLVQLRKEPPIMAVSNCLPMFYN